jgi:uncharacterized protein YndB with AHSA1/START domain
MNESEMNPAPPGCEIVSSRIVKASREIVYAAWTDPGHLKNWWGPAGFTNTFKEFDLRPGGKWRFIMHGPDKGHYPNECTFTKIEPPALIAWKRSTKPFFNVVVLFEEISTGQTKIIFRMIFSSELECNKVKIFAPDKNEENFDRLESVLTKMTP